MTKGPMAVCLIGRSDAVILTTVNSSLAGHRQKSGYVAAAFSGAGEMLDALVDAGWELYKLVMLGQPAPDAFQYAGNQYGSRRGMRSQ